MQEEEEINSGSSDEIDRKCDSLEGYQNGNN